jgi:plastocyanin
MQDKCPNCGEPLVTKTIKKKLATGSIDYPISQTCPKCNWSRDLTGASDIVSKPVTEAPQAAKKEKVKIPPAKAVPPKSQPMPGPSTDINRIIIIALAILVVGGLAWAFLLYPGAPAKQVETPKPTATVTQTTVQTPTVTVTTIPKVTPTGNKTSVELDIRRGFVRNGEITIKLGDEIIWTNTGTDTLTLISSDGLFDAQILANDKKFNYTFKKTGTYNFYLKENPNLNGTIVVEP